MSFVKLADELGRAVEEAWRAVDYRRDVFPELAERALERHAAHRVFSTEELARWVATAPPIVEPSSSGRFGEPPVTLFTSSHFYIEALFWLDGTTAIHQHSFSGAFQVLAGSSIHTRFRFTPAETLARELCVGELAADDPELLAVGAVRQIWSGSRLIHSLFHLDRPSVTLVVRTRHDAGTDPQYSYLPPGIAFDPFHGQDRLPKLLQLFESLGDAQSPARRRLLGEIVDGAELHAAVMVLLNWCRAQAVTVEERQELLARLGRRHAGLAEHLGPALEETRRQALVIDLRKSLHAPEHRFLLSALLNVRGRERILALVAERHPGVDPVARIAGWIDELGQSGGLGVALGEGERAIFRLLLEGRGVDEIVAALGDEYDGVDEQRREIEAFCEVLRGSALFGPLFARR